LTKEGKIDRCTLNTEIVNYHEKVWITMSGKKILQFPTRPDLRVDPWTSLLELNPKIRPTLVMAAPGM